MQLRYFGLLQLALKESALLGCVFTVAECPSNVFIFIVTFSLLRFFGLPLLVQIEAVLLDEGLGDVPLPLEHALGNHNLGLNQLLAVALVNSGPPDEDRLVLFDFVVKLYDEHVPPSIGPEYVVSEVKHSHLVV